jgi:hypothetical protein
MAQPRLAHCRDRLFANALGWLARVLQAWLGWADATSISRRATFHEEDDVGQDPHDGDCREDDRHDKVGSGVIPLFALHGLVNRQAGARRRESGMIPSAVPTPAATWRG